MRLRAAILVPACALAGAWALLGASSASAHATLQSTTPERGAELGRAPAEVVFRFDESVEASLGALSVFDSNGERVDDGTITHPGGAGDTVATGLEDGLGDGSYTATYRVISADSHPVEGGFVFQVGRSGAAPSESVSQLLDSGRPGAVTQGAMGATRWLIYLAIAVMAGGIAFLIAVWRGALPAVAGSDASWAHASERFQGRWKLLAVTAASLGILATLLGLILEGALGAGTSGWEAARPSVIEDVLGTRFGTVWALRAAVFAALAIVVLAPRRRLLTPAIALAGCLALVVSPALAGHGSTQSPTTVLFPSISVHVAAMSVWAGGLIMLVAALPAATRELDPPERTRLLGAVLPRFSALALASVVVLLITGTLQSILELESFDDLLHTGFGVAILAKIVLVALLIGAGAVNRRVNLPAIAAAERARTSPGAAGRALRRTLRTEVVLITGALIATAALASSAPPSSLGQGPFAGSTELGPARVDLTVDPATVGPNEIHVYLTDSETGVPFSKVRQFTANAELPGKGIGPLELDVRKSGPGHYTIPGAQLAAPGDWTIAMSARVSAFDEYDGDLEVPVR